MLAQIRRALKPDGLLLAAMVGGDHADRTPATFAAAEAECEGGRPRVALFADWGAISAAWLQRAGFALPVTDDCVVVRYDNAFVTQDPAADGRDQYFARASAHADPPRHALLRMADPAANGLPTPTVASAPPSMSFIVRWAPHESQPNRQPGSAKASSRRR